MNRLPKNFEAKKPGWCPGCGDFAVFTALKKALCDKNLEPYQTAVVAGIGCSGKMGDYLSTYAIHTLHGRALAIATGIKLVNPQLKVIVVGGDGDAYAIGVGHLIHTCRRNPSMVYIVMNNEVYGLTKGQVSPTANLGLVTSSTPYGSLENQVDGAMLAIVSGATFVARGFSGDLTGLTCLINQGLEHPGLAFIEVLSPCVTFNKEHTYDWYRQQTISVEDIPGYDLKNRSRVLSQLTDLEKIPLGLLYQGSRPTFEEQIFKNNRPAPIAFDSLTPDFQKVGELLNKS